MNILQRLRDAISRRQPSLNSIFQTAFRNESPVNFSFTDKDRLPRNIGCRINLVHKRNVYLRLVHPMPASIFSRDRCRLFFKLNPEIMRKELGIRSEFSQNGFLFKSRILDYYSDSDQQCRQLCVSLPAQYTRRELRCHERYRIYAGMISEADLWILNNGESAGGIPDFSCNSRPGSSLFLLNISAGGAKVLLDKTDFLDDFADIDNSAVLLRLALIDKKNNQHEIWQVCKCMASHYSIRQRRFSMRLQFSGIGAGVANAPVGNSLSAAENEANFQEFINCILTNSSAWDSSPNGF